MIGSITVLVAGDFEAVIERVTGALKTEGFGVLTRIDLDSAFKEKLGVEFRPYSILGACNPNLAHAALSANSEVGLLLPCNVTVEQEASGIRVRIADPGTMISSAGLDADPAIKELGEKARARLMRAAATLRGT